MHNHIVDKEIYQRLKEINNLRPWNVQPKLDEFIKTLKPRSTRTNQQSKALHLWMSMVAEELQKQGMSMQNVLANVKKAEIKPTMEGLKEVVIKPMIEVMFEVDSTAKLEKLQVDELYEVANAFFSREPFCIHVPFPTEEKSLGELTANPRGI